MSFLYRSVAMVAMGACAAEREVGAPDVEPAFYTPSDEEEPCPANGCGGNSPVVDGVYFWELNTLGLPNAEGVRITGVVNSNGEAMRLRIDNGDELTGVDPVMGTFMAAGTSLIDTRIGIEANGQPYEIRIGWAAPSESFWVGPTPTPIWVYDLYYHPLPTPENPYPRPDEHPLCSEAEGDPTMIHAMTFSGDRYKPKTKKITTGLGTHNWINIACADSAVYKQHKGAHTSAAGAKLGIATTLAQRHAMLNAWTSNVCGTGEAFTHQGEPITLTESLGIFNVAPYNSAPLSLEAVWDEHGAVCLGTHRLEDKDPEILDKITVECGGALPPPCSTLPGLWTLYGHALTGNL